MSAYRTPFYNRAIGDCRYSMHQWGSAADIYVDPKDMNRMEDLNRDGRIDVSDSKNCTTRSSRGSRTRTRSDFRAGWGSTGKPALIHRSFTSMCAERARDGKAKVKS